MDPVIVVFHSEGNVVPIFERPDGECRHYRRGLHKDIFVLLDHCVGAAAYFALDELVEVLERGARFEVRHARVYAVCERHGVDIRNVERAFWDYKFPACGNYVLASVGEIVALLNEARDYDVVVRVLGEPEPYFCQARAHLKNFYRCF